MVYCPCGYCRYGYTISSYSLIINAKSSYYLIFSALHKIEGYCFMYVTQEIAERIKLRARGKKVTVRTLLSDCGMNINAISEFSRGKQLSCISLAKIADYLDCSVDYLLGRTDVPEVNRRDHT